MKIEWQDRFNINIDIIDQQHRQLIEKLNDLYSVINSQSIHLRKHLSGFQAYANEHFATEERIAFNHNIDRNVLTAHIKQHDEYRLRMAKFDVLIQSRDPQIGIKLYAYLNSWWVGHVLTEDRELGLLIHQQMDIKRLT